jgi:hypothetical protein
VFARARGLRAEQLGQRVPVSPSSGPAAELGEPVVVAGTAEVEIRPQKIAR